MICVSFIQKETASPHTAKLTPKPTKAHVKICQSLVYIRQISINQTKADKDRLFNIFLLLQNVYSPVFPVDGRITSESPMESMGQTARLLETAH